ncbi:MAG TPA: macro domain-containing protein [Rhizomicrobium sp.]|jgi:O-acetyl-ADP-ribose deacetylase (regulator of RNase III)
MGAQLSAIEADIATLDIQAIVNAANEPLVMGGGVDGAIRRKAGPEMERELRAIGHCPTGEAVLTGGHRLRVKFVIHTVAPIWGNSPQDVRLLTACYRNALALASTHGVSEIAFPCMGTGAFGWPSDLAAETALAAVKNSLTAHDAISRVVFCCFSAADRSRYEMLISALS